MTIKEKVSSQSFFWVVLILLFQFGFKTYAQSDFLDSLWMETQKENPPKVKLEKELVYLNRLASIHLDSAIQQIDSLISKYEKQNFELAVARGKSVQSWFYAFKVKYEKAHTLAHEALPIQEQLNDSLGLAYTLNRLGIYNLQFEKFEESKQYFTRSLEYFIALKDSTFIDGVLNNLGVLALEQEDYNEALKYYRKSLQLRIVQKSWHWVAYSYFNIGSLHLDIKNLDSAEYYLNKSRFTFLHKTRHGKIVPMLYLSLSELEYERENYPLSVSYADTSLSMSKELNRTERIIEARQYLTKALYKNKEYKRAYEVQERYLNQKLELDSANNVKDVAEIEERYKKVEREKEIAELKSNQIETESQAQQLKLYILYILIFILVLTSLLLYWIIKRRQAQKINEASLNARISEMKLMALRAQMNPHFIFNSINTAQNFVLEAQTEMAYDYLARFAKLLRIVLENSDQTFIALEDEVNQLQLYLELESIRFENKFQFSLEVDESLKNGVFEIPCMIMQPFVENAVLHGLVNKTGENGSLSIAFKRQQNSILCTIEDNGVGRRKAKEIKSKKKKFYKSAALPNIRERLNIIERNFELEVDLKIEDLNDDGKAMGTKVSFNLPLK